METIEGCCELWLCNSLLLYREITVGVKIVFIGQEYFRDKAGFVEMLNPGDIVKQSSRLYLAMDTMYNGNAFFVPLRKSINLSIGRIGYPVPSSTRPNAGLDFRKALIVNCGMYSSCFTDIAISSSQMNKLVDDISIIEGLFTNYVKGYVKAVHKNRAHLDRLFKFSTLHNFHAELGL